MPEPLLLMQRRLAIRLLHEAQLAGETPFTGVVGARGEPDCFAQLDGDGLAAAVKRLGESGRELWAVYLHRPGQPTQPAAADFAEYPQALRLTASLATKGVLQLRVWVCEAGRVSEREMDIKD
jgi:hypothetical protein